MNKTKLFLDSGVILDYFLDREPFSIEIEKLVYFAEVGNSQLFTSSVVVSNIYYIASRKTDDKKARKIVKIICKMSEILPVTNTEIELALNDPNFKDFEGAIQYCICKKHNIDHILTRNVKDYKNSDIPVNTPEAFLIFHRSHLR